MGTDWCAATPTTWTRGLRRRSRQETRTLPKNEIATNRRIAKARARNAVTGPWVAVNGPAPNGNRATSRTPKLTNTAAFRHHDDMLQYSLWETLHCRQPGFPVRVAVSPRKSQPILQFEVQYSLARLVVQGTNGVAKAFRLHFHRSLVRPINVRDGDQHQ